MIDSLETQLAPFRFLMPTEVHFGAGSFNALRDRAAPLGGKALVVTGKHSARASGALDRALAQLPGAVLFDEVEENPRSTTCDRAAALCREAECDFVVAIGGGSPIDVAKAVGGLARNEGPCGGFFGSDRFVNGSLPVVAVPTTAGTGSEVTPGAVIVDAEANIKRTISGRACYPDLAILDPELTVSMPRDITVNTGLDALSQAAEGMVSKKAGPVTDALAVETCRLVRRFLPWAAEDGSDIEARSGMLYAAFLSGCIVAQTGTTLVHGMGYYLTLEFGIAHGLANALLLAPLFQHNAEHLPEKVAALAMALGVSAQPTPEDAGAKFGAALQALMAEMGVSPAGKDHGMDRGRLSGFADHIITDAYRFKNQHGDFTADSVHALFEQACAGDIF